MSHFAPPIPFALALRARLAACAMAVAGLLPGCLVVDVGVTNPVRGLRTVAVVPFFNQSEERAVDGRLLASLYASELQKTPGLEVIPIGVVETTMRQYGLQNLTGPRDAAQLALLLNTDAVVIGTVTEYSPYHPPRLGLSVAWYSPYGFEFYPGIPIDPGVRDRIHDELGARRKAKFNYRKDQIIKGVESRLDRFFLSDSHGGIVDGAVCPPDAMQQQSLPPGAPPATVPVVPDGDGKPGDSTVSPPPAPPVQDDARFVPPVIIRSQTPPAAPRKIAPDHAVPLRGQGSGVRSQGSVVRSQESVHHSPLTTHQTTTHQTTTHHAAEIRPLMSYTKVFDAADGDTAAAFRDFLEWRDDGRNADWTARLQWADQFPRFVMRMMIVEMFQLHGGEGRRRVVWKFRKYK